MEHLIRTFEGYTFNPNSIGGIYRKPICVASTHTMVKWKRGLIALTSAIVNKCINKDGIHLNSFIINMLIFFPGLN